MDIGILLFGFGVIAGQFGLGWLMMEGASPRDFENGPGLPLLLFISLLCLPTAIIMVPLGALAQGIFGRD